MKKYLLIMLVATVFVACSNDEEMNLGKFTINEMGEVVPMEEPSTFSEEEFRNNIVNHGWRCTAEYKINDDGSVDDKNYWEGGGALGANPPCFCLDGESLTQFIWMSYIPTSVYKTSSYQYAESANLLLLDGQVYLTILSFDSKRNRLTTLCGHSLLIFDQLTEEELQWEWEQHPRNYYDIDDEL